MSTRVFALVALVATVLVGAAGLAAQTPRPGNTLQLWEYHTEITRDRGVPSESRGESRRSGGTTATDTMLNAWGQDGWELVAVTRREVRIDDVMQTESTYAFKRSTRSVNR